MRCVPCSLIMLAALFHAGAALADPRPPDAMNTARIRAGLHHLQNTASVLYIGAHPDDDNTWLLAALAHGRGVRTAYLSLTRGDGGQNILGSEAGVALGVIRTQELLASRAVDGAEQYFTRALDFGFSKSPDEALAFWGHDRVLADVVWVIRRFQPDVILTRFGTDGSGGHGHHTASAILAGEAFRAAADSTRFPEQLKTVRPWRARRLLWNTWAPKTEGRAAGQPPLITMDAGGFDPALGLSFGEVGGRARSLNRSQGAGTGERRGSVIEYFEPVDGEPAKVDLFDGVDATWRRVPGSAPAATLLAEAERKFDADHPAQIVSLLARADAALARVPQLPIVVRKREEIVALIRSCAGLFLEANAASASVTPGETLTVALTALQREPAAIALAGIELPWGGRAFLARPEKTQAFTPGPGPGAMRPDSTAPITEAARSLALNQPLVAVARIAVPAGAPFTQPYWLAREPGRGDFDVPDDEPACDPEGRPIAMIRVGVAVAGERIRFEVPVTFRWTDRVYGDRYRALEILPPATCAFDQSAYLFPDASPREIRLAIQSTRGAISGTARLRLPDGWKSAPESAVVALAPGAEQVVAFRVTPGGDPGATRLTGEVVVAGHAYRSQLERVDYPHIPIQTWLRPAAARLVRTDLRHTGAEVGYLMGSGDQGPEVLRQMGFHVTLLTDDDVEHGELPRFDCIVAGVRAYNVRPRLRVLEPRLLDYVAGGGRLVIQYQTSEESLNDRLGPWPFRIARDRVTVEEAEMQVLAPDHAVVTTPNAIGAGDFAGWVQERGLQYAAGWDSRYQTPFSAHDPGEAPLAGGLIYAHHGRGTFIYTGLSFFRQLPAGVPGAWRLFANLVSAPR